MMTLFNEGNTEGYTDEELDALNLEWQAFSDARGLEEGYDEYSRAAKEFCDAVAQR